MNVWHGALSIPDHLRVATQEFTGRGWVFDQVDAWLATGEHPLFVIAGGPGTGKSALMARLVEMSNGEILGEGWDHLGAGSVAYAHFCRVGDLSVNPLLFVESLSGALASRIESFRAALLAVGHGNQIQIREVRVGAGTVQAGGTVAGVVVKVGDLSIQSSFDRLVRIPLAELGRRGMGFRVFVLVDALDEARSIGPESILTLLRRPDGLPDQLRILVTTRPDSRVLNFVGAPNIDLDKPPETTDIAAYAYKRLKGVTEPERSNLVRKLVEAGGQNFLYTRYVLDDLLRTGAHSFEPTQVELPDGLTGHYWEFLQRELVIADEQWQDRYRPILGALAVARGDGLTTEHLMGITQLPRSKTEDALRVCAQYLTRSKPAGPFRIYHRSFAEYLTDEDSEYRTFPDEDNAAIASHFCALYGSNWLACKDNYALEYTPAHLMEAIRLSQSPPSDSSLTDLLTRLLADLAYLEARSGRLAVEHLLDDLRAARQLVPTAELADVLAVLDAEATSLRRRNPQQHPAYFAQQIHNRAVLLGLDRVAQDAQRRLAELRQPFLELRWRASPPDASGREGHREPLFCVAATADGRAVSGSRDTTLIVWDVESGQLLHTLEGHTDSVWSLATTADGRRAVSASWDGTLCLWDLDTGRAVHVLVGHEDGINRVALTAADRRAVSASDDHTLRVWDLESGKMLHTLIGHESEVGGLAVTHDGRLAVSGATRDPDVRVWNLETGTELYRLPGHDVGVPFVTLTPDGTCAISGGRDGTIRMWDLDKGALISTLIGHDDEVWQIAVSPGGDRAVSGARDGGMKVWNLETGTVLHHLDGHEFDVDALVLSKDGRRAYSSSWDRTVKVWDVETGAPLFTLAGHEGPVWSLAATADRILSASWDCSVRVWDAGSGELLRTLAGNNSSIRRVVVAGDGGRAVTSHGDGTLQVWDTSSPTVAREVRGDGSPATALCLHTARDLLLAGYVDGVIRAWSLGDLDNALEGRPHRCRVMAITNLAGSDECASVAEDGTFVVWNVATGEVTQQAILGASQLEAAAVASDTGTVVYSSRALAAVWHRRSGGTASVLGEHKYWIRSVDVTADGRLAVTAAGDRRIGLWDLIADRYLCSLLGHEDEVWSVAVDTAGSRAASASWDRMVMVWDLRAGGQLAAATMDRAMTALACSDDVTTIVTGDGFGGVYCFGLVLEGGPVDEGARS